MRIFNSLGRSLYGKSVLINPLIRQYVACSPPTGIWQDYKWQIINFMFMLLKIHKSNLDKYLWVVAWPLTMSKFQKNLEVSRNLHLKD